LSKVTEGPFVLFGDVLFFALFAKYCYAVFNGISVEKSVKMAFQGSLKGF